MNIRRQVKFLYRSLARAHRWQALRKPQVVMVVAIFAIFLAGLVWTPFPAMGQTPTATPAATSNATDASILPTPTPFSAEITGNSQQTIGITFAGAVLVLIVVVGVIAFLPQGTDSEQP
jgi:hypothetical protein